LYNLSLLLFLLLFFLLHPHHGHHHGHHHHHRRSRNRNPRHLYLRPPSNSVAVAKVSTEAVGRCEDL
jgi:ABC-type Zn2+ transport system substrate-binding protein/surface adhesin